MVCHLGHSKCNFDVAGATRRATRSTRRVASKDIEPVVRYFWNTLVMINCAEMIAVKANVRGRLERSSDLCLLPVMPIRDRRAGKASPQDFFMIDLISRRGRRCRQS